MRRDWTPFEYYLSEQSNIKRGYGDIFDFMENLKIVYNDGTEVASKTPEEMALIRQFPSLGRYLMDAFFKLYDRISQFEDGVELLHEKNDELTNYIKAREYKIVETATGDIGVHSKAWEGSTDSYLLKWFEGKLDERFYYNERNNELLIEHMCKEALERGLSNWILTDPDYLQLRRQIGFADRGVFELVQVDEVPGNDDWSKSLYCVAVGEIDCDEVDDKKRDDIIDSYGYENMQSLIKAAGSRYEAYGQLAEMLFEVESSDFHVMQFETWNEALAEVERRTGKNLEGLKETGISLESRIEKARSLRQADRNDIKNKGQER